MKRIVVVALFLFIGGCTEKTPGTGPADTGGTLVIATTADPGTLFPPFSITTQAKQISEQIYDYLADVGPDLNTRDEAEGIGDVRGARPPYILLGKNVDRRRSSLQCLWLL